MAACVFRWRNVRFVLLELMNTAEILPSKTQCCNNIINVQNSTSSNIMYEGFVNCTFC